MGLPSGYKRLAYLLGSNSAYSIISGLHLTDADEVRAEVYITGNCNVYGCYTGSSAGDNFSLYVGSTYYARMDGKVVSNVSSSKNARLALVHNKEGMWINGTKRITFTDVGEFTASTDFYIGWLDNASSAKVIGRIYRLEVVGKFVGIPAMRVSDGVCGLYDTLNGTFYASNGTAWAGVLADETERSLLARRRLMMASLSLLPYDSEVEYLGADSGQYINTNFTPQIGDEIECEFCHTSAQAGVLYSLFSAGTGASQLIFLSSRAAPGAYYRYFSTGGAVPVEYPNTVGVWYKVVCTGNGTVTVYNGAQYSAQITPTTQLDANTTLFIFLRRNSTSPFHGRLRYFRIKRGGSTVMDLQPVRIGTVGYLYDRISGNLLGNAGSGNFILGPDI